MDFSNVSYISASNQHDIFDTIPYLAYNATITEYEVLPVLAILIIIIIIINDTYKAQIRKKKSTNALLAVKQVCLQLFPEYLGHCMCRSLR